MNERNPQALFFKEECLEKVLGHENLFEKGCLAKTKYPQIFMLNKCVLDRPLKGHKPKFRMSAVNNL
jgi:hypothetical protein